MIQTPKDFTEKFPSYVYRSGKGSATVQWRQAAIDMANEREKLVRALRVELIERDAAAADAQNPVRRAYEQERAEKLRALLTELGEYAPRS